MNIQAKTTCATDPCPCKSGKTWGSCCGELLENKNNLVSFVRVRPGEPKYFVVSSAVGPELYTDEEGKTPVFLSRKQAAYCASKAPMPMRAVIGIAEEKFGLFAIDVPNHYIVPASEAVA